MGIIFTDKVEHRHGSKKVSRKTAKIEMKIKQEELKQLKQQRRQQQWADLQERMEQQQIQKQSQQQTQQLNNIPTYVEVETPTQEVKQQINQATLEQLQEQQAKIRELLNYKQTLKTNEPPLTKTEYFITIMVILTWIFTFATIIIPCIVTVISGCILNKLDTPHQRYTEEMKRVNNEIKTTQKVITQLKANLY